MVMKIYDEVVR